MCARPVPIHPGSRLEEYEVVRPLGGGGMGEIWLARDLTLNRSVALKVLRADLSEDSERVTRFRREAYAASALNHREDRAGDADGREDDHGRDDVR